jgi:hypothetical protein
VVLGHPRPVDLPPPDPFAGPGAYFSSSKLRVFYGSPSPYSSMPEINMYEERNTNDTNLYNR